MQLTFRVRAYPTERQYALFADYLDHTRRLYNAALEERIDCYRKTKRTLSNNEQAKSLTVLRATPEYAVYPRRMQRWALNLVERAYKGMFSRHRNGDKLGHPRFRSRLFWSTVGWDSPINFVMRERGIYNRKAFKGTLRLRHDRELPPFTECTAFHLCCDGDRWFAHLTYKVPDVMIKQPRRPVGIDVGLKVLAVRSDGVPMDASRVGLEDVATLRRAGRALSRCKKRSKRRIQVKQRLRKIHARIANKRKARLHEISARLTHHFDGVAVEDLNLKGLNRSAAAGLVDAVFVRVGVIALQDS